MLRRLNNYLKSKEDVNGTTTQTNFFQEPTTELFVESNVTTNNKTTCETTSLSGSEWTTTNLDVTGSTVSTNSYSETTENIFIKSNETTTENTLETNETTIQVSREVTTDVPSVSASTPEMYLESTTTLLDPAEAPKNSSDEGIETISGNPLKSNEDFLSSPQGTTTPKIFKSDDNAMFDDDNGNPRSSKMGNMKNPAFEILPFSFESGEIILKSPQESLGASVTDLLEDNKETAKTNFGDPADPFLGFPPTMATIIDATTESLMKSNETTKQPESPEFINPKSNESSTEFQTQSRETILPSISITTVLPESEPHGTTAPAIFKSDNVNMYDDDATSNTSNQNQKNARTQSSTDDHHGEETTELTGIEYYDEYEYYYDDDNTTVLATVGASSIRLNNSTNLPKTFANEKLNKLFQQGRGTVSPFITGEDAPNSFPDDYDDSREYYDESKSYSEEVSGEND